MISKWSLSVCFTQCPDSGLYNINNNNSTTVLLSQQSYYSLPALWVQRAEDDSVHCVMSPEKQPARRQPVSTCGLMWHRLYVCLEHTGANTHFLWLSVSVIPCADTLKWTTVDCCGGSMESVIVVAFWTAWCPVSDSSATEPRYHTLHAAQ